MGTELVLVGQESLAIRRSFEETDVAARQKAEAKRKRYEAIRNRFYCEILETVKAVLIVFAL